MNRSSRQKLALAAAVAALACGGAVAAVTAVGQGRPSSSRAHAGAGRARDLAMAASYLGLSAAQLRRDLQSGQTLAQVADATAGKSAAGLIQALLANKRARLQAALANLPARVSAEVNGASSAALGGGAGSARFGARANPFAARKGVGAMAAAYLGVSAAALQSDLRSGQTLAELANATPGKSAGGLIDALVADRKARLAAAASAGNLSAARVSAMIPKLTRRVTLQVNRKFPGG
jgi:hypothetical protein